MDAEKLLNALCAALSLINHGHTSAAATILTEARLQAMREREGRA